MTFDYTCSGSSKLPRMRTLPKAMDEIRAADPETDFTLRALRRLAESGDILTVRVGSKTLVNLDYLFDYLSLGGSSNEGDAGRHHRRRG